MPNDEALRAKDLREASAWAARHLPTNHAIFGFTIGNSSVQADVYPLPWQPRECEWRRQPGRPRGNGQLGHTGDASGARCREWRAQERTGSHGSLETHLLTSCPTRPLGTGSPWLGYSPTDAGQVVAAAPPIQEGVILRASPAMRPNIGAVAHHGFRWNPAPGRAKRECKGYQGRLRARRDACWPRKPLAPAGWCGAAPMTARLAWLTLRGHDPRAVWRDERITSRRPRARVHVGTITAHGGRWAVQVRNEIARGAQAIGRRDRPCVAGRCLQQRRVCR